MTTDSYRHRVNALALIAGSGFAGANMFIGTSMGVYWLSLDPIDFMNAFGPQFQRFLITIMPLFLLTFVGLVLSARLDWHNPVARRSWLMAISFFGALSLITLAYHMPENLRLLAANYTPEEAEAARLYWLSGHVPRVVLGFLIPIYMFAALAVQMKNGPVSNRR